ncbi:hypothetical protein DSO57_1035198 [Entomophthora muscae]|uniref:Uncharacterized protein n=1 Tax=Entomophthora muscae TaxID=34485 RepID=A0ACC2SNW5_9FUNG|nr:hypothetical protein DSO57_1035198 [Entomophthora muscae]
MQKPNKFLDAEDASEIKEQDLTPEPWQDLNPDPDLLQAASPEDQWAGRLRFSGVEPLQAELKRNCPNNKAIQTWAITPSNKG